MASAHHGPAAGWLTIALLTAAAAGSPAACSASGRGPARPSTAVRRVGDAACVDPAGRVLVIPQGAGAPMRLVPGDHPSLSPDGSAVAYVAKGPAGGAQDDDRLAIADVRSGRSRDLLAAGARVTAVAWSPTGAWIAFATRDRDNRMTLEIVEPGGGSRRPVCGGPGAGGDIFEPVWAGDGRSILYHDLRTLHRVALDGRTLSRTPVARVIGQPMGVSSADRFVPCPRDADLIAFTQAVHGTPLWRKNVPDACSALYVFRVSTGARQRLTAPALNAVLPAWSRDGASLYFCGFPDTAARETYPMRVYRANPKGGGLRVRCRGERLGP